MSIAAIVNIFAALVVVAGTTVVVSSPQTASIIKAVGDSFSSSVRAATGR